MKNQLNALLLITPLLLFGCATSPSGEEPVGQPTAVAPLDATPVEIEPEVIDLGGDCGQGRSPEECANVDEHAYLQFVEADNICNDNENDEIVQFNISFADGKVVVSDLNNGETREYSYVSANIYSFEKTFENGWVDSYVIEFTAAGFTEVYEYTDPDQGSTLPCHRITRTLNDGS